MHKIIFFILLITSPCFSQKKSITVIKKKYYNIQPGNILNVTLDQAFNGVCIKATSEKFDGVYIVSKKDTIYLKPFQDQKPEDYFIISIPVLFIEPIREIAIYSGGLKDSIEVHFYLPIPKVSTPSARRVSTQADCGEPYTIPPSIWREGLPAPTIKPSCTQAEHVIIHHSAIENNNLSATDQIRFIYTFHTRSNGWDDIGYNFLVAEDGTIFQGRDTQGACEKDNTKGAHFCAKNENTMGICLMGNYSTSLPSFPMLNSLYQLITWKVNKESLSPLASSTFPVGSTGKLPVIAGHRDGCNTECPGENVYALMNNIKDSVFVRMSSCFIAATSAGNLFPPKLSITAQGDIWINTKEQIISGYFTDVTSRQIPLEESVNNLIHTSILSAGIYILRLQIEDYFYTYRFLKK